MTQTTKQKELHIKEGRTELTVPHREGKLTFIHPSYGPDTYAHVASSIEQAGLYTPTLSETTALVYAALQSNDKYSAEIKKMMKGRYVRGFTGILYLPNEGAYVQDHPSIEDGLPVMDRSELVKKLEAHDPTVRHVPFGFKTEAMSSRELAKNKLIHALVGEEGAEKLAEIADKHIDKPYLWSFTSVDKPTTRVSALDSGWGVDVRRLLVNGYDHDANRDGCAFGVCKSTGVASRAEK